MHDPNDHDLLERLGYEKDDIKLRPILRAIVAFFVFTTIGVVVGSIVYFMMSPEAASRLDPNTPQPTVKPLPANAPPLQSNVTAKTDIQEMRRHETQVLSSYGVVDAKAGVYRIPIDEALKLEFEKVQGAKP